MMKIASGYCSSDYSSSTPSKNSLRDCELELIVSFKDHTSNWLSTSCIFPLSAPASSLIEVSTAGDVSSSQTSMALIEFAHLSAIDWLDTCANDREFEQPLTLKQPSQPMTIAIEFQPTVIAIAFFGASSISQRTLPCSMRFNPSHHP